MIGYASAAMPKKVKNQLDEFVKNKFDSNWKGVDNPESLEQFRNFSADDRKVFLDQVGKKFRKDGGLGAGQARLAVTDTEQLDAAGGHVLNVGEIDDSIISTMDSGHPDYPFRVPGKGLGQLPKDGRPLATDLLVDSAVRYEGSGKAKAIYDDNWVKDKRGHEMGETSDQTKRAMMAKPYGGIITEGVLRKLEKLGYNVGALTGAAALFGEDEEEDGAVYE